MAENAQHWAGFLDDVENPHELAQKQSSEAETAKTGKWAGFLDDVESPVTGQNKSVPATPQMEPGLKRVGAQGINALYTGINRVIGTPGDIEAVGREALPAWMTREKFWDSKSKTSNQLFPTTEDVSDYTQLGMERRPDLKPQNAAERYGTGLVEAVPNALTMMSGMGPARALITAGLGAVGAEGAKDILPENKWAPIVGGVIGTLTGGWGTGAIKGWMQGRAAAKELLNAQTAYADAVEAARTGRYDATTGVANIKSASQANLNATKDLAAESVEAAEKQAQETFETGAKSWGTSTTPQQAGTSLQESARNWMTKVFPEKMAALRKPLDAAIPAETPVELSNFNGTLSGINKTAGSLQPLVDVLTKAMPRQLAKATEAAGDAEGLITSGPTWGEARTLRSAIGDAMKDPELVSKIGESNLQALYKAVTSDLTKTAKGAGAENVWKAFNEGATKLHNFADNTLSKVISSTDKAQESIKPEDVATLLLSGAKKGGTDLAALQAEMPGAIGELSSAQLRLGAKAWGGLKQEAKNVLVPDPAQRASFDQTLKNTQTAAENAKKVVRDANREHAAVMEAAQADARSGNFENSTAIVEARKRKMAAEAKATANSMNEIKETLHGMKKSAFGILAANALGPVLHMIPGGTATAELAAAMAPSMVKWGKNLLSKPSNVMIPIAGVNAGQNALAPETAH